MLCLLRRLWTGISVQRRFYSVPTDDSVVLRPYQEASIDACLKALKSGTSRIGVSLPTGSGKTTVFISLLSRIDPPPENPDARRALVVVNSVELARQAAAQAERLHPEWKVEIEQGVNYHASGEADLTVATYQTLLREHRLAKFNPTGLKAIIVDEAHHAAAPSYLRILSHFHPAIRHPDEGFQPPDFKHSIAILGFSATFSRHDGLALGSVFERIVYHRDFLEMIKEQWLCNVRFTCVRANIDLSHVTINTHTGDFNATSLSHVINTPTINKLVLQTWLDRASERKSTLIFCVNLAHVHNLTETFREAGIDARYIYSRTPARERRAIVESFRKGEFPVLINCAVLTEGADIPNIDCVIVARPSRSRNVFAQMIGRGMRLSPETGKEDCRVIDFVDSQNRVSGVVSLPTLLGLDPSEVIDDDSLTSLEERADERILASREKTPQHHVPNVPNPKSITYVDYEDPFSFVDEAFGAPHIRKLSQFAWVGCGGDVYILECLGKGYIRIEKGQDESEEEEPHFVAHYTPATLPMVTALMLKISPYQKSREILKAQTLAEAIRGAETYAIQKVVKGPTASGLRRNARWRREPATENQKAMVRKRWKARPGLLDPDGRSEDRIENMTKGEAANIISRIKFGAQVRYEKKAEVQRRAENARAKEELRAAREHVRVGPLPAT
ncbi:P-loop containing nucleoside triphosphate hydrolase protein [Rhodofomes roseus]|uniref:P-loop containing nucleoside triphosphate hydrolase protein n=1 Tax=Rhodofomes roseus TaxID=34475 RepID=A0ABQ8KH61_9APHY|nr:P-loop containing nucleoside triphosphate hydrolase protein [Rhodofomes roseus]KAH9837204.1 P-loop containing nucleoside triphosphate hydrolase protein [Rhodofomes roseus]